MQSMIVTPVISAVIMQIFHPIATPAIKTILTPQAIPIILLPNSRLIVWNVIPPCRVGNLLISQCMMPNFSRYSQENIKVNGTNVLIAIPTPVTMLFIPVSIVMSITGKRWMTSIRENRIINITVRPAWSATQEGITNKESI